MIKTKAPKKKRFSGSLFIKHFCTKKKMEKEDENDIILTSYML